MKSFWLSNKSFTLLNVEVSDKPLKKHIQKLKEADASISKVRNLINYKNFMFHISVFKINERAAPWHSRKHQGATLDHPGLTTALQISQRHSSLCEINGIVHTTTGTKLHSFLAGYNDGNGGGNTGDDSNLKIMFLHTV
jgi:hypothetical protein